MLCRLYIRLIVILGMLIVEVPAFSATGFLDTPDSCLSVQKINGNAVYLQRVGECSGEPGRVFIDAVAGDEKDLFIDELPIGRQKVKSFESVDVAGVITRAQNMVGERNLLSNNSHDKAMGVIAEQTKYVYESQQFQEKVSSEITRIQSATVGTNQLSTYYKNDSQQLNGGKLAQDERVYLFVSSSMPMHVIRTYIADVARLNDRNVYVVMRGFIQGMSKIQPSVNFMANSLKKDSSCTGQQCEVYSINFIIDPLLYRKYQIKQVPSFVYAKDIKTMNPDMSEGDPTNLKQGGSSFMVYGDASLRYALLKLSEAGGAKNLRSLATMLH